MSTCHWEEVQIFNQLAKEQMQLNALFIIQYFTKKLLHKVVFKEVLKSIWVVREKPDLNRDKGFDLPAFLNHIFTLSVLLTKPL